MVTTVTTTTTTTVTTVAAATITLIAILALLALMIQKEIFSNVTGARAERLARTLNISIVPLFMVFLATVAYKIYEVLW